MVRAGARLRTSGTPFLIASNIGAQRFGLPITNADEGALRAVRPRVAVWIDKLRHAGHVVFVPILEAVLFDHLVGTDRATTGRVASLHELLSI